MSILQRKAQVGKKEHQARAMTVPKSLRVGLAKVADEAFDLALAVIGVTHETCTLDEALEPVTDDMLMLTMDGRQGLVGGAVISHELVSAMVQQQTTGRVTSVEEMDRAMTATDAALCAPLLDRLFERAHGFLETPEDRDVLPLFRFGARAENKRLFALALEEPEYTVLRLTVDIAGGVGQAKMTLVLPLPSAKPLPSIFEEQEDGQGAEVTLEPAVMSLKAEMSAVLCRINMPLVDVSAIQLGQELPVSTDVFDAVQLVSIEGDIVATGAMGQVEGQRALMLHAASGPKAAAQETEFEGEAFPEAGTDYSDLNLPDLDLPTGDAPIDPSNLEALPDLPALGEPEPTELPDLPETEELADLPSLPDLPDLPDLDADAVDLPSLDDLPKIDVA